MIHWTPIQEHGKSDGTYSIRNQLANDPSMSNKKTTLRRTGYRQRGVRPRESDQRCAQPHFRRLPLVERTSRSRFVALNPTIATAINHTLGYNPFNLSYLIPALELNTAILDFCATLQKRGLLIHVTSAADVDSLMNALTGFLKSFAFRQHYVLDSKQESVKAALSTDKITLSDGPDIASEGIVEFFEILEDSGNITGCHGLAGRFSAVVESSVATRFVKAAFSDLCDVDTLADVWVRVVDVVNVSLYEEWKEGTKVTSRNANHRLKYIGFGDNGLRLGPISIKCVPSRPEVASTDYP